MTQMRVYLGDEPLDLGDPGWARQVRQRADRPSWHVDPRLDREPGMREFDPRSGCWVLVKAEIPGLRAPRRAPRPFDDGTKQIWVVVCRKTDHVLWKFRAGSWDAALGEKRRLCRASGYRSGDAFLTRV